MLATTSPFPLYFDKDGNPLSGGYLYFGQPNLNPETNPVTVYWDAAGSQPTAQPIRTLNGWAARSGTPALVYAAGDYSLTVKNSRGELVFYARTSAEFGSAADVLAQLAGPAGSSLVGFLQSGAGAVPRTAQDKMREQVSGADYGFVPGNLISYSAAAITAVLDELRPQGKELVLAPGIFRIDGEIRMGNGSALRGAGGGYSDNAKKYTQLLCTSISAASIIHFYDSVLTGYIESSCVGLWVTYETPFDHTTFAGNERRGFYLENQLTNSTLDDLYASECRYGYYAPKSIWSSNIGNLSATLCYMGWFSGTVDYATSLAVRSLQIWRCFHGAFIGKITYCSVSGYLDTVGMTAPTRFRVANEVPVGLAFSEAKGVSMPSWGSENSSCIQLVATQFSTVNIAGMRLDQNSSALWTYDAARLFPSFLSPLMAVTKQAMFITSDSAAEINGLSSSLSGRAPTVNDLFAITTSSLTPNFGGIFFYNSFLDAPAYALDYPKSSVNPAAVYYSNNLKVFNVLKQFVCMATSDLTLPVFVNEYGVGADKINTLIWQDYSRRYVLEKITTGTTMQFKVNVYAAVASWGALVRLRLCPSESAPDGARATAGNVEVQVELLGKTTVSTVTLKSPLGVGIGASVDGGDTTAFLVTGLVSGINYTVYVEETLNRFSIPSFPVTLIKS